MPVPIYFTRADGLPVATLGVRQRYRFEPGEQHVHHCPECYEEKPCTMDCEFEPDLSESEDGLLRGSHCACDECRPLTREDGEGP